MTGRERPGFIALPPVDSGMTGVSESVRGAVAVARETVGYVRAAVDYARDRGRWDALPERRAAFLQWVEGADERGALERNAMLRDGGISRRWGELLLTVRRGPDGERRYDLRHEDDADRSVDELVVHDDPLDARDVATYDDEGNYRPLKTAPTLRTGWVFPNLSGGETVEAVDFFYPATVANWHREREGALDVSHWRETAERQTGIYDLVDELSGEQVQWLAESCCVDSQCLKRRMWDEDEDTELGVDRGDGEFPCREPCSLVIAAARKWAVLEGETEREYTVTLTPSEKGQLEELVEAVAEGRTDEIREADVYDGANRYRTRWLRAKRFDEDGELPMVEREDAE